MNHIRPGCRDSICRAKPCRSQTLAPPVQASGHNWLAGHAVGSWHGIQTAQALSPTALTGRDIRRCTCGPCVCMQAVSQETGQDLDPSNRSGEEGPRGPQQEGAPEQGAILASKVHTIKPFGVFVQMQGWRTNGLVHVRQVLALMLLLAVWLLAAGNAGFTELASRAQSTCIDSRQAVQVAAGGLVQSPGWLHTWTSCVGCTCGTSSDSAPT